MDKQTACPAALLLLLALGLVVAAFFAWGRAQSPGPREQTAILDALRQKLLASPSIGQRHPDACRVLREWQLLPSGRARTEPSMKTIHMAVTDQHAKPYDARTLLLVLLHELAHASQADSDHAAGSLDHNDRWARQHASLLQDAVADGLMPWWAEVDPAYPAQMLPSPEAAGEDAASG